jgi:hypothetical protein
MSLRFGPAGVDTIPVTNEPMFRTRQELKAFYKAQLAELQVRRRNAINKMRRDVLDLLEGSGITLREIYTCGEPPKKPKQITYKLNDGSHYTHISGARLPAELKGLSKDQLRAREVAIQ